MFERYANGGENAGDQKLTRQDPSRARHTLCLRDTLRRPLHHDPSAVLRRPCPQKPIASGMADTKGVALAAVPDRISS